MCDRLFSSLSKGDRSCNFLPLRKNNEGPLGNDKSRKMSTLGSPIIGNSGGIVSWLIAKIMLSNT